MEGKAKEALSKFQDSKDDLDRMINNNEMLLNSLAIEWLDTVKLKVYAVPVKNGWFSCIRNGDNDLTHGLFIDRESATEAAIKKAVEIYNARFS
ncbi:hypothetical protein [Elizabethkingia ursingii]|uniref:hypothetical protein n=1 Tax=Elizabethkingia ursingii TaxID=1756150 RepID=UPI0007515458|nr:hypothetical protein [Elizabethkingia ursingii]KUY28044.1 hypothetical protein ATB96_19605 [Elizabethkingia ursingii]